MDPVANQYPDQETGTTLAAQTFCVTGQSQTEVKCPCSNQSQNQNLTPDFVNCLMSEEDLIAFMITAMPSLLLATMGDQKVNSTNFVANTLYNILQEVIKDYPQIAQKVLMNVAQQLIATHAISQHQQQSINMSTDSLNKNLSCKATKSTSRSRSRSTTTIVLRDFIDTESDTNSRPEQPPWNPVYANIEATQPGSRSS